MALFKSNPQYPSLLFRKKPPPMYGEGLANWLSVKMTLSFPSPRVPGSCFPELSFMFGDSGPNESYATARQCGQIRLHFAFVAAKQVKACIFVIECNLSLCFVFD